MKPTCGDSVMVRVRGRFLPAVYLGERGRMAVVSVLGEGAGMRELPGCLVVLVLN